MGRSNSPRHRHALRRRAGGQRAIQCPDRSLHLQWPGAHPRRCLQMPGQPSQHPRRPGGGEPDHTEDEGVRGSVCGGDGSVGICLTFCIDQKITRFRPATTHTCEDFVAH